jgi:hypothetical protein
MSEEINSLKEVSKSLEKLQLELEPIRDKALDEVARLTGYSQCAEQFIKLIVARMVGIQNQIKDLEGKEVIKVEQENEKKIEEKKKIIEQEKKVEAKKKK